MPLQHALPGLPAVYRPRRARDSPLYRVAQDWFETLLLRSRADSGDGPQDIVPDYADASIRGFLECGIERFGLARFLCRRCGKDRFVTLSCKKRLACPSCDSRRSVVTTSHAMEDLLPQVPYRQVVLVLPKRLRYFIHRDAPLVGELTRILTKILTRFYRSRMIGGGAESSAAAPIQLQFIQRFGSKANLHIHVHAVLSDGCWFQRQGALVFEPAGAPTAEDIQTLTLEIRRRVLRRFLRLGAIEPEIAAEIMAREHSGFSLHAGTCVAADDREGLKRLLQYCTRPAIAVKRMQYLPDKEIVRYAPLKTQPGEPVVIEWNALEFLSRFAKLIPPPWINLVRYAGALGPRSKLRPLITQAAQQTGAYDALRAGWRPARLTLPASVKKIGRNLLTTAQKTWAMCLRKVFEVNPVVCVCGAEMKLVAVVLDEEALLNILTHLGWPCAYPVLKPPRSPPEAQLDSEVEKCYGIDDP